MLFHIFLAILLFFLVNQLGKHSPSSLGYYQLTSFLETDEAPAFNYVMGVLTPTIYIILVSTGLYYWGFDRLTSNIYMVSVYYVLIRTIFNIAINRHLLINWAKRFFYSLSIIVLSYFVYIKLIVTKTNILPDFNNMANELWLIIIIFLYNFINNIKSTDKNVHKRKENYIEKQFFKIKEDFEGIIDGITDSTRIKQIAFAIIIYEDFNRPKLFRYIEYINHFFSGKQHTLGIMQVSSKKYIDDEKSVELGTKKLVGDYNQLSLEYSSGPDRDSEHLDEYYQRKLIERYNPGKSYSFEILDLANEINVKYFNNGPNKLFHT